MAENPQSPLKLNLSEWKFLPDNTSCLELGLEDFKTLISNEVIDTDYFRSEPCDFIQQFSDINNQDEEEGTKIKPKEMEPMNCTKSARSDPKKSTAELSLHEVDPPPPCLVVAEKIGVQEEDEEEKETEKWEGIRIGNWKCRLADVGALCSNGAAAAATICVLALDGREVQQPPHRCRRRSSVAQFRVHRDDKMPAGVAEKAGKLNQALAAARGMPAMARAANISFGGYYSRPLINSRLSPSDDTCSFSFRGR